MRALVNVARMDDAGFSLSCEQEGVYFRLLRRWIRTTYIPDDDDQISSIVGVSRTIWKRRYASAIRPLFLSEDGHLEPIHGRDTIRLSKHGFGPGDAANRDYGLNWPALRAQILERDEFTCQYCFVTHVPMECDHVIPHSRGGPTTQENLVAACAPCNRSKSDRTPEEWRNA
jgi:hypothetical protein